ncbi:MAG: hypothetical protein NW202_11520 [Nitrospira sp.]|nr:hypothetical protein [Nitrospira sp.]
MVLHGLLFLSLLPLFRQPFITLPQERFHWEVSLVQSAQTADESVQTVDTIKPTVSKHPEATPTPDRTARSSQHAASYIEHSASLVPRAEEPAMSELPPSASAAAEPSDKPTMISRSDEPTPSLSQTTNPPPQQTGLPIDSPAQAPPPLQEVLTATSAGEDVAPTTSAMASSPPATRSDATVVSGARPDYGWLQQAIFHRLEELKRSSRPSLDESRPLKVLVKAVVSREGILLDSAVVKSSGLDRIDQEAMALVQRAFPMQLDRPLDRQQVAMRIPITYSRE